MQQLLTVSSTLSLSLSSVCSPVSCRDEVGVRLSSGGGGGGLGGGGVRAVCLGGEEADSVRLTATVEELRLLDEQYAWHRARYDERMKRVNEGEAKYNDKRLQTVAYLRRFKTFIAETDTKRMRAEKKEAEEKRQKEDKERELHSLHRQLRQLHRQRNVVQRQQAVHRKYKEYLESVLLHSEQYTEVDELSQRHTILTTTQHDLAQQAQHTNQRLEELQATQQARIKTKQNTSAYAMLLVELEGLTNSNGRTDAQLTEWASQHGHSLRYATEVNLAIRNIHHRLTQHKQPTSNGSSSTTATAPPAAAASSTTSGDRQRRVSAPAPSSSTPNRLSSVSDDSSTRHSAHQPNSVISSASPSQGRSRSSTLQSSSGGVGVIEVGGAMSLTEEELSRQRWRQAEAGHQAYLDNIHNSSDSLPHSNNDSTGHSQWSAGGGGGGRGGRDDDEWTSVNVKTADQPRAARRSLPSHPAARVEPGGGVGRSGAAQRQRRGSANSSTASSSLSPSSSSSSSPSSSSSSTTVAFLSSLLTAIAERVGDLQFIVQTVSAEERAAQVNTSTTAALLSNTSTLPSSSFSSTSSPDQLKPPAPQSSPRITVAGRASVSSTT